MEPPPENDERESLAALPDAQDWSALRHDLRQPLQALKLLHGALRRAAAGRPALLEMLEAQQDAIEALEQRIDGLAGGRARERAAGSGPGEPRPGASETPTGSCVLIVDDDALIRRAWERLLGGEGHRVASAASLAETRALLAVGSATPALVLTDYHLRDGNGLAVVHAVRAATGATTPALVITGDPANIGPEIAGLENCRIATKPVGTTALLDLVRTALRRPQRGSGAPVA